MLSWIQTIDDNILNFVQSNMHNPILDKIMPILTTSGNLGIIWILLAIVLLFTHKYRKCGILILCSILFTALMGEVIIKNLVQRIRPCNVNTLMPMLIDRPTSFSFPSGHTSSSFAAVTILWKTNRKFGVAALLFAILIAFSRMYVYVHYPSDVLVGMTLGILCSSAVYFIAKTIEKRRSRKIS